MRLRSLSDMSSNLSGIYPNTMYFIHSSLLRLPHRAVAPCDATRFSLVRGRSNSLQAHRLIRPHYTVEWLYSNSTTHQKILRRRVPEKLQLTPATVPVMAITITHLS